MDPKEHLRQKLESHRKSKAQILSPDFDPGAHSVDYWLGYHKGVEFGYEEGMTILEAAEEERKHEGS